MQHCLTTLSIIAAVSTPAAAWAQQPARYVMERTETGIARLDTQTGVIDLCQEKDGGMVCRIAADERAAFERELDVLTKRIESLEKGVSVDGNAAKPRLPTDEEIDQTMGIMERMMRSFMGIVKEFEGSGGEPAPQPGAEPQKT